MKKQIQIFFLSVFRILLIEGEASKVCKLFSEIKLNSIPDITIGHGVQFIALGFEYLAIYTGGSTINLYGQRISMNATKIGSERVLLSDICSKMPYIEKVNDTHVLITYMESTCTWAYYKIYRADLTTSHSPVQVNPNALTTPYNVRVYVLTNGKFLATYYVNTDLLGQVFNSDGTIYRNEFTFNTEISKSRKYFVNQAANASLLILFSDATTGYLYNFFTQNGYPIGGPDTSLASPAFPIGLAEWIQFSDRSYMMIAAGNDATIKYKKCNEGFSTISSNLLLTSRTGLDNYFTLTALPNDRFALGMSDNSNQILIQLFYQNGSNFTDFIKVNTATGSTGWFTATTLMNSSHLGVFYYGENHLNVYFQSYVLDDVLPSYVEKDSSGMNICNPCVPPCFTCNQTICFSCVWPMLFINGSCFCPPGPLPTLSMNSNSPCLNPCAAPFQNSTLKGSPICINTCTKYLYNNGSCLDSCDYPLVMIGGIYCSPPCSSGYYFFPHNNTCLPTCPTPRISIILTGALACVNPCQNSFYFYPNLTCMAHCPDPRVARNRSDILFCDDPCPGEFLYWNSSCIAQCSDPFHPLILDNIPYCRPCNVSMVAYWDLSCSFTCDPPGILNGIFCDKPCNDSMYAKLDSSCISTCPYPYIPSKIKDQLTCFPPCRIPQYFLNYTGLCVSDCNFPLTLHQYDDYYYCGLCAHGYYWTGKICVIYTLMSILQIPDFPNRLIFIFERPINFVPNLLTTYFQISFPSTLHPNVSFEYSIYSSKLAYVNLIPKNLVSAQTIHIHITDCTKIISLDGIPMNESDFYIESRALVLACPLNCFKCISITECVVCSKGYILSGASCYPEEFAPYFQIIQDPNNPNIFSIYFDQRIILKSTEFPKLIQLNLSETDSSLYNFSISRVENLMFKIELFPAISVPEQQLTVSFAKGTWLTNEMGVPMINGTNTKTIKSILEVSLLRSIQDTANTLSSSPTTATLGVLLTTNPTLLWIIANLMQNYYYLLFLNIEIPYNLLSLLQLFKLATLNIIPIDMPTVFQDPPDQGFDKFLNEGMGSSFLINATGNLLLIGFLALGYIISVLSLKYLRFLPSLLKIFFMKYADSFKKRTALNLWLSTIMNFSIFLQLQFCFMSKQYSKSIVSVVLAHMFLMGNIAAIFLLYRHIKVYQLQRKRSSKLHIFIQDYLSNIRGDSKFAVYTLCIVALKKFMTGIFIVLCYNTSWLQILTLALTCACTAIFYAIVKPFAFSINNFQAILNEISEFVVYLLILISQSMVNVPEKFIITGWMICYWILCCVLLNVLFSLRQMLPNLSVYSITNSLRKLKVILKIKKNIARPGRKFKRKIKKAKYHR